jgi:hypothetical protein
VRHGCITCGDPDAPLRSNNECDECAKVRARARSRALSRLKALHEGEYAHIYREEVRRSLAERWGRGAA